MSQPSKAWGLHAEIKIQKRTIPPPIFAVPSRQIHSVPQIGEFDEQFSREGIPELLTPEAYRLAWTDYQQYTVDRLNTILKDDEHLGDNLNVKQLALLVAREPRKASVFNYASMAHNNHFFFQCLSPTETAIPEDLKKHLISSFSSIETLHRAMYTTAAAMFGPGFVWLVQDHNPSPNHPTVASASNHTTSQYDINRPLHFRLLTTYLAGSPYPGAHNRQQGYDMNHHNLSSATAEDFDRQTIPQNRAGSFGRPSFGAGMAGVGYSTGGAEPSRFGGADITPVLCVNTWEHVWMWDFGVSGKRAYLEKWWSRINWEQVWANCHQRPGLRHMGVNRFLS